MIGLLDGDAAERLSQDDMASRTEAMHLAAAIERQRLSAARLAPPPGTCRNCGEACLPRAVYCDEGCRDDHERRLGARTRSGGCAV